MNRSSVILGRSSHRTRVGPEFAPGLHLVQGRLHEGCGPARRVLACALARAMNGPILWVTADPIREHLNADGLRLWANPARLTFVAAHRPIDILWVMEEALRSGACPLVIAELGTAPGLTPVRRMHLAAEAGAATARTPPLGLLLTPETGGAQGIESRWHMASRPGWQTRTALSQPGPAQWTLTRLRARMAPPATWIVTRSASDQMTIAPCPAGDPHGMVLS